MELINVILGDQSAYKQVFRHIRDIDRDNNGYVTSQELDDILKLEYREQLEGLYLKRIFKPFASIQNTILIDYKKLRKLIEQSINWRQNNIIVQEEAYQNEKPRSTTS